MLKETEKIKKLNEDISTFLQNIDSIKEEEKLRFELKEYTEKKYKELLDEISMNEKRGETILYATSVIIEEFKNELQ